MVLGGVVQNLSAGTDAHTLAGATQFLPGGPVASPGGRSRSSAPTAAASSTPTPRTRSRARRPGSRCSRSSCCWSSRSRCRAPSAGWSATSGRATRSSRVMADAGRGLAGAAELVRRRTAGGTATQLAGAATEGKEVRFGGPLSALFADRHHADLDRRDQRPARQLHPARRRRGHGQHDARRGRARRRRLGPLRDARPGRHHGLRRRADGRAHPGVPGQEARAVGR